MTQSHLPRLLLLFSSLSMVTACGSSKNSNSHTLTLKVVSKTDESPFYTRLATESSRVLITDSNASPQSGVNLDLPEGHELFVVELDRADAPKLASELFREERLVLFTARDEREAFIISSKASEFAHPRKVKTADLKQPSAISTPTDLTALATTIPGIQGISIDAQRMREDLEALSGARPIVVDGQSYTLANRATADNKTKARAWLKASYEALGFTVIEHRYSSGVNLIAEKKSANPVDDQVFMVSGHMDTVQTAGADDDGSGTISSLTIARALASLNLKRAIRFVAFDEEERGLIGSEAYAKELNRTGEISKVSLLNIEMTGYDSDNDGDFHTIDCNENSSPAISQALMTAISSEGLALKKVEACTNRSDHAVFWEYNRPAIVISQNFFGGDSNPCYHRTCDTVQKMNWEYMEKLTRAAANAVFNLNR